MCCLWNPIAAGPSDFGVDFCRLILGGRNDGKIRFGDGRRHGHWPRGRSGAVGRGVFSDVGGPPPRPARGGASGHRRGRRQGVVSRMRCWQTRRCRRAVRRREIRVWPARPAVQQRRHGRPAVAVGGFALRGVAAGGWRQSRRRVPMHAGGVPHDEGANADGWTHRQQWFDFGAHAPAQFDCLHINQARGDWNHQGRGARRAQIRHCGRPDRHRQRRKSNGR